MNTGWGWFRSGVRASLANSVCMGSGLDPAGRPGMTASKMRRIGIDVGGTNTDAVLLEDGQGVHAVKTPTTEDVTGGIVGAPSGSSLRRLAWPSRPRPQTPTLAPARSDQDSFGARGGAAAVIGTRSG